MIHSNMRAVHSAAQLFRRDLLTGILLFGLAVMTAKAQCLPESCKNITLQYLQGTVELPGYPGCQVQVDYEYGSCAGPPAIEYIRIWGMQLLGDSPQCDALREHLYPNGGPDFGAIRAAFRDAHGALLRNLFRQFYDALPDNFKPAYQCPNGAVEYSTAWRSCAQIIVMHSIGIFPFPFRFMIRSCDDEICCLQQTKICYDPATGTVKSTDTWQYGGVGSCGAPPDNPPGTLFASPCLPWCAVPPTTTPKDSTPLARPMPGPTVPSLPRAVWEQSVPLDTLPSAPVLVTPLRDGSTMTIGGVVSNGNYAIRSARDGETEWLRRLDSPDSLIILLAGRENEDGTFDAYGFKRFSRLFAGSYPYRAVLDGDGIVLDAVTDTQNGVLDRVHIIRHGGRGQLLEGGTVATTFQGTTEGDALIRLRSPDGVSLWQHTYEKNDALYLSPIDIVGSAGGGLVVAMQRAMPNGTALATVIRTDETGTVIWRRDIGPEFGTPARLAVRPNGEILLTGCSAGTDRFAPVYLILEALDSNGVHMWRRQFSSEAITCPSAMVLTPDGGAIIGGTTGLYAETGREIEDSTRNFYLVKTDADGERVWEQTWGVDGVDEVVHQLAANDDGSIAAVGYSVRDGRGCVYVAKVSDLSSSAALDIGGEALGLRAGPNPASSTFTVCVTGRRTGTARIVLHDMAGVVVREEEVELDAEHAITRVLDVAALPSGRYLLSVSNAEARINAQIVVVR